MIKGTSETGSDSCGGQGDGGIESGETAIGGRGKGDNSEVEEHGANDVDDGGMSDCHISLI